MEKSRQSKRILASIGTPTEGLNNLQNLIAKKKKEKEYDPVTLKSKLGREDEESENKAEDVGETKILGKESSTNNKDKRRKRKKRFTFNKSNKKTSRVLSKRKIEANDVKDKDKDDIPVLGLVKLAFLENQPYSWDRVVVLEDEIKSRTEKRYKIGDIVSILDENDGKYFAQIIRLHMEENGNSVSSVSIRWLLPKSIYFGTLSSYNFDNFDPVCFESAGPIHDIRIRIEAIQFVMNDPYYEDLLRLENEEQKLL